MTLCDNLTCVRVHVYPKRKTYQMSLTSIKLVKLGVLAWREKERWKKERERKSEREGERESMCLSMKVIPIILFATLVNMHTHIIYVQSYFAKLMHTHTYSYWQLSTVTHTHTHRRTCTTGRLQTKSDCRIISVWDSYFFSFEKDAPCRRFASLIARSIQKLYMYYSVGAWPSRLYQLTYMIYIHTYVQTYIHPSDSCIHVCICVRTFVWYVCCWFAVLVKSALFDLCVHTPLSLSLSTATESHSSTLF